MFEQFRRWVLLVLGVFILVYETLTPGDARVALAAIAVAALGLGSLEGILGRLGIGSGKESDDG